MTDFGTRPAADGATEDKQDDVITALGLILAGLGDASAAHQVTLQGKLDTLHTDITTTILALIDGVEGSLTTIDTKLGKLHGDADHTLVDAITFDDDPTTYEATGVATKDYRFFALAIDLAVVDAPTDIVIAVQFSDDDSTYYNLMNGPFGDLRYEDTAGAKKEVLVGRVIADYMRVYVVATGTDSTHKFTLTVKLRLMK